MGIFQEKPMARLPISALLAILAALALAACAPGGPARNSPDRDACGASAYFDMVGQNHAQFDFSPENHPVRILGPNSPMTMDYQIKRLNVDIDNSGQITRVWCG